jgi:hypothetical protein
MAVYGHDLFFTACSRLITAEYAPLFFPPMVHPNYKEPIVLSTEQSSIDQETVADFEAQVTTENGLWIYPFYATQIETNNVFIAHIRAFKVNNPNWSVILDFVLPISV